jgi:ABC-type multidrug transport system permease subunit
MIVKSHADQSLLTSFVITPMAFLGGTFFPLESLPNWAAAPLNLLPLSHASKAARQAAFGFLPGPSSYIALAVAFFLFFILAVLVVSKARD